MSVHHPQNGPRPEGGSRKQGGRWRGALRLLPLVLLVGVSVAVLVSGAARLVSLDSLLASRAWLHGFVEADRLRALVATYLVYVGAVVVSVPATLMLTMICGFLFGIVTGALVTVAAATTVGRKPRLKAPRAVEFTHICVMKPARMTSLTPAASSCA